MPSLATFTNFQQAQGPAYLTGPNFIRHAGQKTGYAWAKLSRGKPQGAYMKTTFGTDFREKVFLSDSTTFQTYTPYDALTVTNPQTVVTAIAPEVYGYDAMTWSEQEAIKNGQNAALTTEARSMMYLDFMTQLQTRIQVSLANGMETKFLAIPTASMEGASQTEPCSLIHLINEFPNSLYVNNSVSMGTKHQINPAAANNIGFRNHIFGYDSISANPTGGVVGNKNLLNAMDTASLRLTYDAPKGFAFGKQPQNWEDPGWPTKLSMWSYTGVEKIMDLARKRNDTWTRVNEMGIENPVYRGMEICAIPGLETAAVYTTDTYTTNTAPNTEGHTDTDGRGPRGYIIDTTGFNVLFNKDKMFQFKAPIQRENQFVTVQYVDVYYQYMITAPWTCGIIAPGTVSGTFPNYTYTASQVYDAY